MSEQVILLLLILDKHHPVLRCHLADFRQAAGQADDVRLEPGQILIQVLGCIPLRVEGNKHRLYLVRFTGLLQLPINLGHPGQHRRADVRTMGVTEEQDGYLALELCLAERLAVVVS